MRTMRLLRLGGCEGRIGAQVVEVEGRGVGGEQEGLGRLGVEDGGRIN